MRPSSMATCAVDASSVPRRPSNSPITPSTTARSAPAEPWANSGTMRSSPDRKASRLRPDPAGGETVVGRVDVVGPDLERRDPRTPGPQGSDQSDGHGGLAAARRRRGDDDSGDEGYHSIPRWPFSPTSNGCLTLTISVTMSAASRISGRTPPAGDDHVLGTGPCGEHGEHLVGGDPAAGHDVGELVEDQQLVGLGGDRGLDLLPSLLGQLFRGRVLALDPGPGRAHLVPGDAERLGCLLLADLPLARLHELEDPDRPVLGPAAQHQPEGSRRLALALAGVHDQPRLGPPGAGGEPVRRHRLRHALRHQAALSAWTRPARGAAASSSSRRQGASR